MKWRGKETEGDARRGGKKEEGRDCLLFIKLLATGLYIMVSFRPQESTPQTAYLSVQTANED